MDSLPAVIFESLEMRFLLSAAAPAMRPAVLLGPPVPAAQADPSPADGVGSASGDDAVPADDSGNWVDDGSDAWTWDGGTDSGDTGGYYDDNGNWVDDGSGQGQWVDQTGSGDWGGYYDDNGNWVDDGAGQGQWVDDTGSGDWGGNYDDNGNWVDDGAAQGQGTGGDGYVFDGGVDGTSGYVDQTFWTDGGVSQGQGGGFAFDPATLAKLGALNGGAGFTPPAFSLPQDWQADPAGAISQFLPSGFQLPQISVDDSKAAAGEWTIVLDQCSNEVMAAVDRVRQSLGDSVRLGLGGAAWQVSATTDDATGHIELNVKRLPDGADAGFNIMSLVMADSLFGRGEVMFDRLGVFNGGFAYPTACALDKGAPPATATANAADAAPVLASAGQTAPLAPILAPLMEPAATPR